MSAFASVTFWVLLFFGRDELEAKTIWLLIGGWLAALVGCSFIPGGPYYFMALVALVDVGLILAIFRDNISIG